jgi:hypothetical protein
LLTDECAKLKNQQQKTADIPTAAAALASGLTREATLDRARTIPPWMENDGAHTHPTNPSRKRAGPSSSRDLTFSPASSPFAKRAVIRMTPEKVRDHIRATEESWLLQQLDDASSKNKLTERQRKYQNTFKGLMAPSGEALLHPAAPLLLEIATLGCKADVGEAWTMEMLEAAIKKGAHPSALQPDAAGQLWEETLEKVAQGYARLVTWAEIKNNPPKNLKISPIAAIPHKS